MEILYLLVPLAVLFVFIAVAAFIFSVRSGQYEDLEGPGHRILMDDDDPLIPKYGEERKAKRSARLQEKR
ncbi:MAG TPA: cbb3-type cytochrome oxidase assembly protein CcoS [Chromatiales bacterium]|nr:cbb3-type cytochrome oxidase assembly protein CcoS [Thiotrichales bacterium]HIP67170.1 cbb3-type cytochrome oxidase assembly protein CcoS [Chromatiales bacterium]